MRWLGRLLDVDYGLDGAETLYMQQVILDLFALVDLTIRMRLNPHVKKMVDLKL